MNAQSFPQGTAGQLPPEPPVCYRADESPRPSAPYRRTDANRQPPAPFEADEKPLPYFSSGMVTTPHAAATAPHAVTATPQAAATVPHAVTATPQTPITSPQAVIRSNRTNMFTAVSATLLIVGLLLLGAAIVPLLSFLQVDSTQSYFVGLGYLAVLSLVLTHMTNHLIFTNTEQAKYARAVRTAVLVATELATMALAANSDFRYRWEATLVVMALIVLATRTVVGSEVVRRSYTALRVNEISTWFIAMPFIACAQTDRLGSMPPAATIVCYGIVLAAAVSLAVIRARELGSPDKYPLARNAALNSLTAIAIPLLASAYVAGCTPFSTSAYAFDAVIMIGALAASAVGFRYSSAALRHTGLATLILAIAKMATVDALGLDPLGRAIAYLVGGAMCVAMGMLYSFAAKKLVSDSDPPSA